MGTSFPDESPLHIPEIRCRIRHLVSVKDAISCSRVSKAWNKDFTLPIWSTIDFNIHSTFESLDSQVIARNGHHIRTIKNLMMQPQLDVVLHASVTNVKVLHAICPRHPRFRSLCMDLIGKNSKTLQRLSLEMDDQASKSDLSNRMISVNVFVPDSSESKLSSITLRSVCFSRNSFAYLLKHCPSLTYVDLQSDVVMFSGPAIDVFQHQKIRTLVAPIKQVFKPDSQHEISPLGSSLLSHFPNLLKWHCYDRQTTLSVPFQRIKAEVDICCPKMSQIATWKTPSPTLYDILANVFRNLKYVTFEYEQLSRDIIMALLFHQSTLLCVSATSDTIQSDIEQDDIFSVDDPFEIHGRALQLLPRTCSSLTILNLECHKMDMDHVEEEEWACKGLQQLRVRIKDLNTKEKVATALQLWTERRNEGDSDDDDHMHGEHETDLQMRVARHLLKFKKLHSVWLGTHVYYV